MNPTLLSHQLRNETSPDLQRRRWVIGLSFLGIAFGKMVSLFQTGILKTLPDPPLDIFDTPRVNSADYAYRYGGVPDAFGMVVNYGITAALAAAGGEDRAEEKPALPIVLAAKALGDLALTATTARLQIKETGKLCFYCTLGTITSAAVLALTIPEALRAMRRS